MDQGSRITFIFPKMAHGVSLPQSQGRLPEWVLEPASTDRCPIPFLRPTPIFFRSPTPEWVRWKIQYVRQVFDSSTCFSASRASLFILHISFSRRVCYISAILRYSYNCVYLTRLQFTPRNVWDRYTSTFVAEENVNVHAHSLSCFHARAHTCVWSYTYLHAATSNVIEIWRSIADLIGSVDRSYWLIFGVYILQHYYISANINNCISESCVNLTNSQE